MASFKKINRLVRSHLGFLSKGTAVSKDRITLEEDCFTASQWRNDVGAWRPGDVSFAKRVYSSELDWRHYTAGFQEKKKNDINKLPNFCSPDKLLFSFYVYKISMSYVSEAESFGSSKESAGGHWEERSRNEPSARKKTEGNLKPSEKQRQGHFSSEKSLLEGICWSQWALAWAQNLELIP